LSVWAWRKVKVGNRERWRVRSYDVQGETQTILDSDPLPKPAACAPQETLAL
jgi:hypothetical protein